MSTASKIEGKRLPVPDHRGAPRWSAGRWAPLAIAVVPTLVYFVVVLQRMTYAWDDFVQFGVTNRYGLGRELLTYSLFEHFGPVNRMIHGLLVSWGGLDVRWGIAVALVIFYVYCAALVDLARVLGASWPRTWLALAICTVTPSTVFVAAFLDPFTHVLIPVSASAIALAACIRWSRDRQPFQAVVATLAVIAACLTQERGIFVVVLLVGARLLLSDRVIPLRDWPGVVLRDWRFFVGPVVAGAVTAWVVATFYVTDAPRGTVADTAEFVARAWTTRFVPMVTGTYDLADGLVQALVVLVANLAVLALAVWTIRRRTANVRPWLLLVGWFLLHMTFVGLGRLGVGTVDGFLGDPNFYSYQLPVVVALLASLRFRPSGASEQGPLVGARSDRPVLAGVGAAVMAVLVVVSCSSWADRSEEYGRDYLAASVQDIREAGTDGPVSIAPTQVPDDLVPAGFGPYNAGEYFLEQADPEVAVDVDPAEARFLDSAGRLTAADATLLADVPGSTLGATATMADGLAGPDGAGSLCVRSSGSGHLGLTLPDPVDSPGGALWVRLVITGSAGSIMPATWDGGSWTNGPPNALDPAGGTYSYVFDTTRIEQVHMLEIATGDLCISEVQVYALSAAGPDGCGWVDARGDLVRPLGRVGDPTCRS